MVLVVREFGGLVGLEDGGWRDFCEMIIDNRI